MRFCSPRGGDARERQGVAASARPRDAASMRSPVHGRRESSSGSSMSAFAWRQVDVGVLHSGSAPLDPGSSGCPCVLLLVVNREVYEGDVEHVGASAAMEWSSSSHRASSAGIVATYGESVSGSFSNPACCCTTSCQSSGPSLRKRAAMLDSTIVEYPIVV